MMKTLGSIAFVALVGLPGVALAGGAPSLSTGGGTEVSTSAPGGALQVVPFSNTVGLTIETLNTQTSTANALVNELNIDGGAGARLTALLTRLREQRQNMINASTPGFSGAISYGNLIVSRGG